MKILKLSASWCGPCKMLSKTLEGMDKSSLPEIQEIDIDENFKLAQELNVRGVPTLILLDDEGKELRRSSGYMKESQILEFVKV